MKKNKKVITRKRLFEAKERFHKEQAKLSFEEKLKKLIMLQRIARDIKKETGKRRSIWMI